MTIGVSSFVTLTCGAPFGQQVGARDISKFHTKLLNLFLRGYVLSDNV